MGLVTCVVNCISATCEFVESLVSRMSCSASPLGISLLLSMLELRITSTLVPRVYFLVTSINSRRHEDAASYNISPLTSESRMFLFSPRSDRIPKSHSPSMAPSRVNGSLAFLWFTSLWDKNISAFLHTRRLAGVLLSTVAGTIVNLLNCKTQRRPIFSGIHRATFCKRFLSSGF